MNQELSEKELRQRAEKRVEEVQGFKQNLIAYILVNMLIFIIWLVVALAGGTWFPWFLFPLAGCGIGVGFHAWGVYSDRYSERREALIREEIEKMKGAGKGTGGEQ